MPNAVTNPGLGGYLRDIRARRQKVGLGALCHPPKLDTARPRHCHPVAPSLPPLWNTCSILDTPTAQIAPESDPDKPRCHSQ